MRPEVFRNDASFESVALLTPTESAAIVPETSLHFHYAKPGANNPEVLSVPALKGG